MQTFTTTLIDPADLLDAVGTLPLGNIATCDWLSHWVPANAYLAWANRGLAEGDDYGISNALTYAKRAAASRIDLLLHYNHLIAFSGDPFPAKIDALRAAGLSIPDVVYDLAIGPRNDLEHGYEVPGAAVARHAVGVAELFVGATGAERGRSSIVGVAWNIQASMLTTLTTPPQHSVNFRGFGGRAMLFMDVFSTPPAAKIIDPPNAEIRLANLSLFSKVQARELAVLLRRNYEPRSGSSSAMGYPRTYFEEIKRQGNF